MQQTLWIFVLAGGLGLAGCQTRGEVRPLTSEVEPPPRLVAAPSQCVAADAAYALGGTFDAAVLEEMRIRSSAGTARSVRPTDPAPATADPKRLSVVVEPGGRIVGARCG